MSKLSELQVRVEKLESVTRKDALKWLNQKDREAQALPEKIKNEMKIKAKKIENELGDSIKPYHPKLTALAFEMKKKYKVDYNAALTYILKVLKLD